MGPETEGSSQPVPDKQKPGHFMDVHETPTSGRTVDDFQPRKCLKDLYENGDISADNRDVIANFCATYNVEEKHVVDYLGHVIDIDIRREIRTTTTKERRRLEEERTSYKDYEWGVLIEENKLKKLRVKQLDLYLKEHGLTTIGLKLDKLKAIRCHYYWQQTTTTLNELSSNEEESSGSESDTNYDDNSDNDLVIADLDKENIIYNAATLTFVPEEEIAKVTVQSS